MLQGDGSDDKKGAGLMFMPMEKEGSRPEEERGPCPFWDSLSKWCSSITEMAEG